MSAGLQAWDYHRTYTMNLDYKREPPRVHVPQALASCFQSCLLHSHWIKDNRHELPGYMCNECWVIGMILTRCIHHECRFHVLRNIQNECWDTGMSLTKYTCRESWLTVWVLSTLIMSAGLHSCECGGSMSHNSTCIMSTCLLFCFSHSTFTIRSGD